MTRTLAHLTGKERQVINLVHVEMKIYDEVAEILKIDRKEISKIDNELDSEWRPISKLVSKWKIKTKKVEGFWDFYHWHQTAHKKCHYCGITSEKIKIIIKNGLTNKRAKTRGETLELDRKKPDAPYSEIDNLTYACYWCNNAKTDTFTEDEFLIIGKAISTVWEVRLQKIIMNK